MLGKVIAFVPTKDTKAARAFYEGALGLTFDNEGPYALVMNSGGNSIRIAKTPEFTPAPFTILGWQVSDIEATVADLTAKKVVFERYAFLEQDRSGIWSSPDGAKVAWFKDPDGNLLSVTES